MTSSMPGGITRSLFIFTVPMVFAAGCAAAPEDVCKKYDSLRDDGYLANDATNEACLEKLSDLKERSGDAWKCTSGCMENAEDVWQGDMCPSSCESQYGKDQDGFDEAEVRDRWKFGIADDEVLDELKDKTDDFSKKECREFGRIIAVRRLFLGLMGTETHTAVMKRYVERCSNNSGNFNRLAAECLAKAGDDRDELKKCPGMIKDDQ